MIASRTAKLVGRENTFFCYVDYRSGVVKSICLDSISDLDLINPSTLGRILGIRTSERYLAPILKYRKKPIKYYFYRTMLDIYSIINWKKPFQRFGISIYNWRSMRKMRKNNVNIKPQDIKTSSSNSNIIILLDSSWNEACCRAYEDLSMSNFVIYTMVHDLIPINTPQFVPINITIKFDIWINSSSRYTTKYISNSHYTKNDLIKYFASKQIDIPIYCVPLAQEFVVGENRNNISVNYDMDSYHTNIDENIRSVSSYPYVLFVGTLETRKNVWRMAQAWDRLRHLRGVTVPRLILVGRPGWRNSEFNDLMSGTSNLYGWIEVINSPNDNELEYLYKNCEFAIQVSLFEGWGLPVGEALSYGKTCVVANTTSLPEVGGDLVEYCDPQSVDSIEAACTKLIRDVDYRRSLEERIRNTRLRSWKDVASDMIMKIG
ncbi:MAG: glycosyltransferase family 4 protein [Rhodobiaceae bacterium]|nr:glycosyltransferase family 4 protein [Rhodobiaceae bacterium]